MPVVFDTLFNAGFNIKFTYHADAILGQDFPDAVNELEQAIGVVSIPISELVRSGGGEAQVTQRLRRALHEQNWRKVIFHVEKKINNKTTFSDSHEIDHVKAFENGTIALEIEWNNKDPFFDRDLENFNRLHGDGAISTGFIVTRGDSFQNGIGATLRSFATAQNFSSFDDLGSFEIVPTARQRREVEQHIATNGSTFAAAWAARFTADKFGAATTHWAKLERRLKRGVGSPCPIVGIGIPLSCVTGIPETPASD